MTLLVHFYIYCTNTTGTGSCLSLPITYKNNFPWFLLSRALLFITIGPFVAKICFIGHFAYYAYISGTGSAIAKIRESILLFKSYTSCANFSSVALIAASES